MPRRQQRNAKLNKLLKQTGPNPTDGSVAGNYLKHLTGQSPIVILNKPPEGSKQLHAFGINPFSLEPTDATAGSRYKANMSAYSYRAMLQIGLSLSDLGLHFIEGGEDLEVGFYPALLRSSFKAGDYTSNDKKVSAVTGLEYNQVATRSFSMPFGRQTTAPDAESGAATGNLGDSDESDVLIFLKQAVATGSQADNLVSTSYEPELFKEVSRAIDATQDSDIENITISFAS